MTSSLLLHLALGLVRLADEAPEPEDVKAGVRAWDGGWCAETVGTSGKTAGWEKLQIVRIWRAREDKIETGDE